MPLQNKVVWRDGMFIAPQHFQHADAYHEELLNFRFNSLFAHCWGLTELKINESALKNGNFILMQGAGVFEDGLAFDIPATDGAPESFEFKSYFRDSVKKLEVYLAIPRANAQVENCRIDRFDETRKPRFEAQKLEERHDENFGGKKRDLFITRKILSLLFHGIDAEGKIVGDASLKGYTHMKIAEIVRTSPETFGLKENYIPPCLHVSASSYLVSIIRNLREMMLSKSHLLSEKRRAKNIEVVEFSTFDVSNYWLLHTVNSYIPVLSHYLNVRKAHPETVYCVLSQLAGELTTFALDARPENLPAYLHADLTKSFDELNEKIRDFMEVVIPETCIPIALDSKQYPWRLARITNEDLFETHAFYLAVSVSAAMPPKLLVKEVREKIKIAIQDDIESVVNHSLPSRLAPNHEEHPPAAVSVKVGFQYFRLPSEDLYWKKVRGAKNLAIYLPKSFNGLHVELMAVKTIAAKPEQETIS